MESQRRNKNATRGTFVHSKIVVRWVKFIQKTSKDISEVNTLRSDHSLANLAIAKIHSKLNETKSNMKTRSIER